MHPVTREWLIGWLTMNPSQVALTFPGCTLEEVVANLQRLPADRYDLYLKPRPNKPVVSY